MSDDNKPVNGPKVLVVHLAIGLDLIGSKTSLHNNKYDITATQIGIKATSRSTGRTIVIPYPNVKGFELIPENGVDIKAPAQARQEQAMAQARADLVKRGVKVEPQVLVPQVSEEEQREAANEARKNARRLAKEASLKSLAEQAIKEAK